MSSELLIELWYDMKVFIPTKDRLDAAHILVAKLDDYGLLDGIEKDIAGLDKILKEAVVARYHVESEEDEESEYDYEEDLGGYDDDDY